MILTAMIVIIVILLVYNRIRSIDPYYQPSTLCASLMSATLYLGILRFLQAVLGIGSGSVLGITLPIVVTVIVNYATLTRTVMSGLATAYEDCDDPRERLTGKGSSLGYRFSSLFLAIMTGAGIYGLNRAGLVVADGWLLVAFAVSALLMWVSRRIDSHNYDVSKGSSDATPTKRYHDFMVQGVFWGLSGVTWIAYSIHSLLTLSVADWSATIVIAGGLVALLVIGIADRFRPINYAKIYPVSARDEDDEFWDGGLLCRFVGIVIVVAIVVALYWAMGLPLF